MSVLIISSTTPTRWIVAGVCWYGSMIYAGANEGRVVCLLVEAVNKLIKTKKVGELLLTNRTLYQLVSIACVNRVGVDLHPIFLKNHVLF